MGTDDKKVTPAHAGSIWVTKSIGQDPDAQCGTNILSVALDWRAIAAGIARAPGSSRKFPGTQITLFGACETTLRLRCLTRLDAAVLSGLLLPLFA